MTTETVTEQRAKAYEAKLSEESRLVYEATDEQKGSALRTAIEKRRAEAQAEVARAQQRVGELDKTLERLQTVLDLAHAMPRVVHLDVYASELEVWSEWRREVLAVVRAQSVEADGAQAEADAAAVDG